MNFTRSRKFGNTQSIYNFSVSLVWLKCTADATEGTQVELVVLSLFSLLAACGFLLFQALQDVSSRILHANPQQLVRSRLLLLTLLGIPPCLALASAIQSLTAKKKIMSTLITSVRISSAPAAAKASQELGIPRLAGPFRDIFLLLLFLRCRAIASFGSSLASGWTFHALGRFHHLPFIFLPFLQSLQQVLPPKPAKIFSLCP